MVAFQPQHQRQARCSKLMDNLALTPATGCYSGLPMTCTKTELARLPAPCAECACTESTVRQPGLKAYILAFTLLVCTHMLTAVRGQLVLCCLPRMI